MPSWIESIQNAINYMEDHMLEELAIEDIAAAANASVFHFQRTFAILTDSTVGEYIRRRRLTFAAHDLAHGSAKVIDLALKYGYDTPESFAKAFRRQHKISPSEAKKASCRFTSYSRLVIQVSLKGADPMKYRVEERESFPVIGVKRSFSCVNGENLIGIPQLWKDIHENGTNDRLLALNNGGVKGIMGICEPGPDSMMTYWAACSYSGETPEGLASAAVPASKWVIFEVRGAMPGAMQEAWKKIYSEWFPASGYEHAGTPDLEVYTEGDAYSSDYYSEIWIPVKK
ncbi:AraC family transcriptional regulator [Bacillus sp. FSL H8-0547]